MQLNPFYVFGNWKMNGNVGKVNYLQTIDNLIDSLPASNLTVGLFIPHTLLGYCKGSHLNFKHIQLGSQNHHPLDKGAYTGQVSLSMLAEMNCRYALVGHSEVRQYQQETNALIYDKFLSAMKANITPVLCIGETKEHYLSKQTLEVIAEQLKLFSDYQDQPIMIAYEPVWSIGTGLVPTLAEIDAVLAFIRERFPKAVLIYGGSVNDKNAESLLTSQFINGFLIGGASLELDTFKPIVQYTTQRKR